MSEPYPSSLPKEHYPSALPEQLEALEDSPQRKAYQAYRERYAAHPYEPSYHVSAPDGEINDPNGLCIWQGRCHLFYQAYPPADPRQHWGHCVSDAGDMVNWADLPLAIYPGMEEAVYSGSAYAEPDRVIAMYHGTKAGNMIAAASDPLLLNWEKSADNPVIPLLPDSTDGRPYRVFDPFLWKEEDGWYALSGTRYGPEDALMSGTDNRMAEHLFFSQDLARWTYLGELMDDNPFIEIGNDGACPYFWPIGNKHVLFFFSHRSGPYALLGRYDKLLHKFKPERKVKFNFGPVGCSSLQAPCACPDGAGGLYLIFNIKDSNKTLHRRGAMTLMMHCTLEDGTLHFRPAEGIKRLYDKEETADLTLHPFKTQALTTRSNTFDLTLSIDMDSARAVEIKLLASGDDREYTAVTLYRAGESVFLAMDTTHNSLAPEVLGRMPECCEIPCEAGNPVQLRILIDKCMAEVFANERQYLMQMVYPTLPDSNGIRITALGGQARAGAVLHTIKPMNRELKQ